MLHRSVTVRLWMLLLCVLSVAVSGLCGENVECQNSFHRSLCGGAHRPLDCRLFRLGRYLLLYGLRLDAAGRLRAPTSISANADANANADAKLLRFVKRGSSACASSSSSSSCVYRPSRCASGGSSADVALVCACGVDSGAVGDLSRVCGNVSRAGAHVGSQTLFCQQVCINFSFLL